MSLASVAQQPSWLSQGSLRNFNLISTTDIYLWFRVIFFTVIFLGATALQITQGDFLCPELWQPFLILMTMAYSVQFLTIEIISRLSFDEPFVKTLLFVDAAFIVLFIFIFEVQHPLFLFSALLHISIAGMTCGLRSSLQLALWTSAGWSLVFTYGQSFNTTEMTTSWFINNISMFMAAGISGALGQQMQGVRVDWLQKKAQIVELTNINDLIVENMPSGLLFMDTEFRIQKANRGAMKIFSDLALEGQSIVDFFPALSESIVLHTQKAKSEKVSRFELDYFNYKNERMLLEIFFTEMRTISTAGQDPQGQFASSEELKKNQGVQYLCLLQNITEVRNLELAMQQKEKLAAVGQLAAGIAHEIRNPLASISGSVQLLQGNLKTPTDEDKKLFNIVIKEIDRLNRLISEFLDYVRPDTRLQDPVNLNKLCDEVLNMVSHDPRLAKKVAQKIDLKATKIIKGNYDKLKQALLNIVINSYQAMGNTLHPEVQVSTQDLDEGVLLIVRDNGMGMSKETKKRMFEPFHTTKPQGTGLGLAITHRVFEAHSAVVQVQSEIGQGTEFKIQFNLTAASKENT